jgi:enhancer of mRNA-decapping protein 4
MMTQNRYEEAFSKALGLQDVSTVGWLCTQADAATVLSASPGGCALSQMVLLSLVQQLAADIGTNPSNKLQWIREAALALLPKDPLLGPHLKPVLEQVHAALGAAVGKMQGGDVQSCKLAMHVIHSQMSI